MISRIKFTISSLTHYKKKKFPIFDHCRQSFSKKLVRLYMALKVFLRCIHIKCNNLCQGNTCKVNYLNMPCNSFSGIDHAYIYIYVTVWETNGRTDELKNWRGLWFHAFIIWWNYQTYKQYYKYMHFKSCIDTEINKWFFIFTGVFFWL